MCRFFSVFFLQILKCFSPHQSKLDRAPYTCVFLCPDRPNALNVLVCFSFVPLSHLPREGALEGEFFRTFMSLVISVWSAFHMMFRFHEKKAFTSSKPRITKIWATCSCLLFWFPHPRPIAVCVMRVWICT